MHCQLGMVMVVNPPMSGDMTLDAYKSAAAKTGNSTTPFMSARGGILSQGASSGAAAPGKETSTSTSAAGGKETGTATSTATRATSTRNAAIDNSPMSWGMWSALAGAAALGAVAL